MAGSSNSAGGSFFSFILALSVYFGGYLWVFVEYHGVRAISYARPMFSVQGPGFVSIFRYASGRASLRPIVRFHGTWPYRTASLHGQWFGRFCASLCGDLRLAHVQRRRGSTGLVYRSGFQICDRTGVRVFFRGSSLAVVGQVARANGHVSYAWFSNSRATWRVTFVY